MSMFLGFLYKNKRGLILILLLLISFLIMSFSEKNAVISFKKVGTSLIYPFKYGVSSIGAFTRDTLDSVSELRKIRRELEIARKELNQYKKLLIDFNELKNENNSLRKILRLKEKYVYDSVAAEIIGRDPRDLFDVFIINKGSKHGIRENMPVITYSRGKNALVGKTVEVTPFVSKVMTLNNSSYFVSSIIRDNNVHCLVNGTNEKNGIAKLLYVPKDQEIDMSKSNEVITSGDSYLYPKGLEIGVISSILPSKRYELFYEAEIDISVDLAKLDYVLVLTLDKDKLEKIEMEPEYK